MPETFPQPSSVTPMQNSQQYFRLKTPIGTGDNFVPASGMYESQVSSLALVLGPDSDVATVRATYIDANTVGGAAQATITPDRGFNGLITARPDIQYERSGRKGCVLFEVRDIYNPLWRPDGYSAVGDEIQFETPILDIIQYFGNTPSLVTQRSDKTYYYQYMRTPAGGTSYVVIPAYGRKSGFFNFRNLDGVNTVTVTLLGVKLSISQAFVEAAYQKQLFTDALVSGGDSANYTFKASTDGLWDYLVIGLDNYQGAAMPMVAQLSDDVL